MDSHVGHAEEAIDALHQWCIRRILKIPWQAHYLEPRGSGNTRRQPISDLICTRRLQLFGHIVRSKKHQDHKALNALNASLATPKSWSRRRGRPRYTTLHTAKADLRPLNIGLQLFIQQGDLPWIEKHGVS